MSRKNIVLIVPTLHQGGIERMCMLTARLLQAYANVVVVIFNDADIFYDVTGVEVIPLNLESRPSKIGKITQLIRRILALRKIKKQYKADLSYSFGDTANLANVFSKSRGETWCGMRAYGSLRDRKCVLLPCKLANRVIACSHVMAKEIERMYPKKQIDVLYNPCDMQMIEKRAREQIAESYTFATEDVFTIITMGRAHDVKGYWHLLKAFSIMKREIAKCHLVFIGDGDYSEYMQLATQLGIRDDVTFAGVQANPFSLLHQGNLYLLTSESEGFPNALVEAMAVGIPVMSVNCKSGPAEILSKDYRLVEDDTKVYYEEYGILLPTINGVKNLEPSILEEEDHVIATEMVKIYQNTAMQQVYKCKSKDRARTFSNDTYVHDFMGMV
ncbi:MAG: glycosyltransferase [Eubacteriales bacterium]